MNWNGEVTDLYHIRNLIGQLINSLSTLQATINVIGQVIITNKHALWFPPLPLTIQRMQSAHDKRQMVWITGAVQDSKFSVL